MPRAPISQRTTEGPHPRPPPSTRRARLATTRKSTPPQPARPPARSPRPPAHPPTLSRAARLPTISTSKTQRVTKGWLSTFLRSSLARKSLAPHLRRRTHRQRLGWWRVLFRQMGAQRGRVCGVRARGWWGALCIVDGHAQHERRQRRKDTAEVVPHDLALDLPSQQRDACAKDHLGPRLPLQHVDQLLDGVQRSRQITVPKADHRRWVGLLERLEHATANRLRLPSIGSERQQSGAAGRSCLDNPFQHLHSAVRRAVVHKEQAHGGIRPRQVAHELLLAEPILLVVAGHDQCGPRHGNKSFVT